MSSRYLVPAVSYVKDNNTCRSKDYVVVHRGEEKVTPTDGVGENLDSVSIFAESPTRRRRDIDSFTSDPQVLHTMNKQSINISNNKYR